MKVKSVLLVLMLIGLLAACQKPQEPLKYVIIPGDEVATIKREYQPIIDYLSEGLGREVELITVTDYTAAVEAMRYGHVEIAHLNAGGYVKATEQGIDNMEVMVKVVKADTGLPGYTSVIFALAGTDTTNLNDLTFGFVDPLSTSGYLLAAVYLEEQGITPKESLFAGGHDAVRLVVKNGSVDVGVTAAHRIDSAIRRGDLDEGEVVILWESELVPTAPVVVQANMSQKFKDKLKQLLINVPEEFMLARKTSNTSGFVEAHDADYDTIREALRLKGK